MKLRGAYTESTIRDELIASDMSIKKNESIMRFLREKYGNIDSAYVFTCTPGEDEDIYEILINGGFVVHFEVERCLELFVRVRKIRFLIIQEN